MPIVYPVLYVTGSTTGGEGVVSLSFSSEAPLFRSRGDATAGYSRGRNSGVTGTVQYESDSAAETAIAAAVAATKVYSCVDGAGLAAAVTFSDFAVERIGTSLQDGTSGGDVPTVSCSFTATAVVVA